MKVLYIVPFDLLKLSNGAAVRSRALLDSLRTLGEVQTLVVSSGAKPRDNKEGVRYLPFDGTYCRKLPKVLFQALAVCRLLPLDWGFPRKEDLMDRLGVTASDFDVIVVRYIWCASKLGVWKLGKFYVDVDDIPAANFDIKIGPYLNCLLRPIFKMLYVAYQNLVGRKAAGLWFSNRADENTIKTEKGRGAYLPNVSQRPKEGYALRACENFLLSVGSMDYPPNYMGVDRFLREEWPTIHSRMPELKYKIVGRSLPDEYRQKWEKYEGVEILGFVEDLADLYSRCLMVITPLWAGGGTSVKTIEAVKYGCKTASTPVGVRGFSQQQIGKLNIDVCEGGRFANIIGDWRAKTEKERMDIRSAIYNVAMTLNTEKDFLDSVKSIMRK